MNSKQIKKLRQIYRKDYEGKVLERAKQVGQMVGNAMKPRPRWIPEWVWLKGLSIFIKMK